MNVQVDAPADVALPGGPGQWPFDVRSSSGDVTVIDVGGVPTVRLPVGASDLEGAFIWNKLPDTLALPDTLGLVQLRMNGQRITQPRRDPNLLWLSDATADKNEEEQLTIRVFRRVEVGSPLLVRTRLELAASGKPREVNLGAVWVTGGAPLSITTDLPTRLNGEQHLIVHLAAGTHDVELLQAFASNVAELVAPASAEAWPTEEVWSLAPQPALRQVELRGATPVDADRANVPADWRTLASFRVARGGAVQLVTEGRGDHNPAPTRLSIHRDLWLDLNGGGFTARDEVAVTATQSTRLNRTDGQLGFVSIAEQPQVITKSAESGLDGVELRQGAVNLRADWRKARDGSVLPAVGWSENAESLAISLHLPPGYDLLGASGVDHLSRSWLDSWDLFAVFYVLLVALVTSRIAHPAWGALAALVLVLLHEQVEAPIYVWLVMLGHIALMRLIPAGFFRRFLLVSAVGTALSLIALLVDFGVTQVRTAIFPQTHVEAAYSASFDAPAAAPEARSEAGSEVASKAESYDLDSLRKAAPPPPAAAAAAQAAAPEEATEVVQTGPGVPNWSFRTWELSWSGPVHGQHQLRLYLLTPGVNSVLAFLRVGLSGLLAWLLLRLCFSQAKGRGRSSNPPPSPAAPAVAVLLAMAVGCAGVLYSNVARAQFPDKALLDDLKQRLTAPPACAPECVTAGLAQLEVEGARLTFRAQVAARVAGAYPLPGPAKEWTPDEVRVHGAPASGLFLGADGVTYLRLDAGEHAIEATGPILGNGLTLKLNSPPKRLEVSAPDWEVAGIGEQGQPAATITLRRRLTDPEETAAGARTTQLKGWLTVRRTFNLGATWSVDTQVERVATNNPVTARIPLLPFERVTSSSIDVQNGTAVVTLDRSTDSASFRSVLTQQEKFSLRAVDNQPFSERWTFNCSSTWHCEFSGLDPVRHQTEGNLIPEYSPDPGDELQVTAVKPAPASGASLTVDSAQLTVTPGIRLERGNLNVALRAATQQSFAVQLPADATLESLALDGQALPLSAPGQAIEVRIAPGTHSVAIAWQRPQGMSLLFRGPAVRLNTPVTNAQTTVMVPENRWLVAVTGNGWGPAILFWGYFVLVAFIGFALGRVPGSPLTSLQWVLLTLGASQLPVGALLTIVGWFFALAWVDQWRSQRRGYHNLAQVMLAGWTAAMLLALGAAIYGGLLSSPDMRVVGNGSNSGQLVWYLDRTQGELPQPLVVSTSMWIYRFAMLAWALWLSTSLLRWLQWGFGQFGRGGLWLGKVPSPAAAAPAFTPNPHAGPDAAARAGRSGWRSVFYPQGYPESESEPATLRRAPNVPAAPSTPRTTGTADAPESMGPTGTPATSVQPASTGAGDAAPPSSIMAPTHLTFPELGVVQINVAPDSGGEEDRLTMPQAGMAYPVAAVAAGEPVAAGAPEDSPPAPKSEVVSGEIPSVSRSAKLPDAPSQELPATPPAPVAESSVADTSAPAPGTESATGAAPDDNAERADAHGKEPPSSESRSKS